MNRFEGKTVLITGASRGIGRAIALRFAEEGANVAVNYVRERIRAEQVALEVEAKGCRAGVFQADVRDDAAVRAMAGHAVSVFGAVDVWVNNAGVEYPEPIEEIGESHWDDTFAINVKGLFFCCRAIAPHMLARERGAIVNVASRFGLLGDPDSLPYGASKAAVVNLTKALAKRYAPHIRVNCVAPAYTETDLMAQVTPEYVARFHKNTPLLRVARPEDTAAAVAYLASDDASFTTGATLLVDGGYTLK
ncbi:MAG: SDR family NAD(P)-dependent oxidoreductase [SAR324 cluster bacterium]